MFINPEYFESEAIWQNNIISCLIKNKEIQFEYESSEVKILKDIVNNVLFILSNGFSSSCEVRQRLVKYDKKLDKDISVDIKILKHFFPLTYEIILNYLQNNVTEIDKSNYFENIIGSGYNEFLAFYEILMSSDLINYNHSSWEKLSRILLINNYPSCSDFRRIIAWEVAKFGHRLFLDNKLHSLFELQDNSSNTKIRICNYGDLIDRYSRYTNQSVSNVFFNYQVSEFIKIFYGTTNDTIKEVISFFSIDKASTLSKESVLLIAKTIPQVISVCNPAYWRDANFVLSISKITYEIIFYCDLQLFENNEVLIELIKNNKEIIKYIPSRFISEERLLELIRNDYSIFENLLDEHKINKKFVQLRNEIFFSKMENNTNNGDDLPF